MKSANTKNLVKILQQKGVEIDANIPSKLPAARAQQIKEGQNQDAEQLYMSPVNLHLNQDTEQLNTQSAGHQYNCSAS